MGTTPTDLKKYVANLLALPMERLRLAKYRPELFQWIDITNEQVRVKLYTQLYPPHNGIHCTKLVCGINLCIVYANLFSEVCLPDNCDHWQLLPGLHETAAIAKLWSIQQQPTFCLIHCCSIYAVIPTCHAYVHRDTHTQCMQT